VVQWLARDEKGATDLHRKSSELRRKIASQAKATPAYTSRLPRLLFVAGFRACLAWWEEQEAPLLVDLYGPDSKEVLEQIVLHNRTNPDPRALYKTLMDVVDRERAARGESKFYAAVLLEAGVRRFDLREGEGLEHLKECLAWGTRTGDREMQVASLVGATIGYVTAGILEPARGANRAAREIVERSVGQPTLAHARVFLQAGEIARKSGEREEAEKFFATAISKVEESSYPEGYTLASILYRRAAYLSENGNEPLAEQDLMRALAILDRVRDLNDPLARESLQLLVKLLRD
jgi:hypothetical protein